MPVELCSILVRESVEMAVALIREGRGREGYLPARVAVVEAFECQGMSMDPEGIAILGLVAVYTLSSSFGGVMLS